MKLVVVGAGLYGLSVARAAIAAGHEVTVVEQGPVPNPLGSSVDRHRLIRYPYGDRDGYALMVRDAFPAWERVWADLGTRHFVETGTLAHCFRPGDWGALSAASLDRLGIACERLSTTELDRRYLMLTSVGVESALYLPSGGALLADRIIEGLADLVRRRGTLIAQMAVTAIDPARGAATLADGRILEGDALVVTAGPWTTRLVPGLAPVLTPARQVLIYTAVPAQYRADWAKAPMLLEIDRDEGFYAVPPVDGYHLKIGDHRIDGPGADPDLNRVPGEDESVRILAAAKRRFAAFDDYRIVEAKTCFYTVTTDERFRIEAEDKALILSCCSGHGFKFGPLVGERVVECLDGKAPVSKLQSWAAGHSIA
ncbi:FAD-dependent oxidoreductase [Oleomonas cavernae]|uniref:FAD-dependent oxidoreductase n=1 Tax=Oleomonas cavernae TaxID=2320859 RepID=A0A418WT35_9PROT|nr:FAD-dependent oxidoreductase [Oleomonas cavernae]RJF94385.1 FAD-dependent oxidoreductase [Oleomonas cavernae]